MTIVGIICPNVLKCNYVFPTTHISLAFEFMTLKYSPRTLSLVISKPWFILFTILMIKYI